MEIIFGVPQVSILGQLLLNIFLADLFFIINDTDITSYVDDNTLYIIAGNIDDLIKSLKKLPRLYSNDLIIIFLRAILTTIIY